MIDAMTTQYRAEFDATVMFSNGGGLRVDRFRIDVANADATEEEVAELFIASLNLLMTERVTLENLLIIEEAHKGTHRGPSDVSSVVEHDPQTARVFVELSHVISDGMSTYPGLPFPQISPHLTREDSRQHYAPGVEFTIDRISMVGNTGTYLDSPFHRFADGVDLASLPLSSLADLPAVVIRVGGSTARAIDVGALLATNVHDRAVLFHTGGDREWGTERYGQNAFYLTERASQWLVEHGAKLVGIDAINIDDMSNNGERPAHTLLLGAGIPIIEHMTGLEQLPPTGARFTAVPPRVAEFGTFPVRAFASYAAVN
ncbi:MAG TPA: cyclase family protein [Acidimicrobiales bacterium]|nr:cyclase family protein [Acidimicrobiales bacterium]